MFLVCANPECSSQFDYREGQLIRAPQFSSTGGTGKSCQFTHFWLCGRCSNQFCLEYQKGRGVSLVPHPLSRGQRKPAMLVAA